MDKNEKAANITENIKKPKSFEKLIWLAASVIIALVGGLVRSSIVSSALPVKVVYIAFLLFTSIMAAQKTSVEKMLLSENSQDKPKYILMTMLYYLFVFLSVFYVFFSLWVSGVLSI